MTHLSDSTASLASRTQVADLALLLAESIISRQLNYLKYREAMQKNDTQLQKDFIQGQIYSTVEQMEETHEILRQACKDVATQIFNAA